MCTYICYFHQWWATPSGLLYPPPPPPPPFLNSPPGKPHYACSCSRVAVAFGNAVCFLIVKVAEPPYVRVVIMLIWLAVAIGSYFVLDQDTRTDISLSGILPNKSCGQRESEATVSDIAEPPCWRRAFARCLSPPRPDGAPFGDSGEPRLSHKVQNELSPAVPHAVLTPLHRWTPVLPTRPWDHSTRSGFRMHGEFP